MPIDHEDYNRNVWQPSAQSVTQTPRKRVSNDETMTADLPLGSSYWNLAMM
jgi:hypothetical protein